MTHPQIHHDPANRLFEIELDGHRGHLEYQVAGEVLEILHTIVDTAISGRGVAGRLVEAARAHARDSGLKLASSCSYASDYLSRHSDASS